MKKNRTVCFRIEGEVEAELEDALAVNGLTKSEFYRLCTLKEIEDYRWKKDIIECLNKDRNNMFETTGGTGKSHNSIKYIHYFVNNIKDRRNSLV